MGLLLRPFPSYATLVVVLAAVAGGVLIGRAGRADQAWTAGPASPDRALEERRGVESSSPPALDEGKSVPEVLGQPMFASSVLESLGFVAARADAVGLPSPAESDSL